MYSLHSSGTTAYKLPNPQFKHLQQHYMTIFELSSIYAAELVQMDNTVDIWLRCCIDKTYFHSEQYQHANSTRLNHLVCIEQYVDANANFSYRAQPEHMVSRHFYAYVDFYCVHIFRGAPQMLVYSGYRHVDMHDDLVEDKGHHHYGFQDIRVLQHMCTKVTGFDGKVYFVDEREVMEKRLRDNLTRK